MLTSGLVKFDNQFDVIIDGFFQSLDLQRPDPKDGAPAKLKEALKNMVVQTWLENPNPVGAACKQRIEEHQKILEFEEAFDWLTLDRANRSAAEVFVEYVNSADLRPFSKKKLPAFVYRVNQIRNNCLTALAALLPRAARDGQPNGAGLQLPPNEIALRGGATVLQTVLLNHLLLMKNERLFGVPPTFPLDQVVYSEANLSKLSAKALVCLYKENLYAGKEANAALVLAAARASPMKKEELRSLFPITRARVALQQNRLREAFEAVGEAVAVCQFNPKINDCLAEILFRSFLQDEGRFKQASDFVLRDFFDALHRMLFFNYQKYENRVFSSILVLFTVYLDSLGPINKILKPFFERLSPNFLRSHFYEIALCFSDDVLKIIYERLCSSQLLEFYYIFDTFTFGVNSEENPNTDFFCVSDERPGAEAVRSPRVTHRIKHKEMFKNAVNILKNYLPRQTCMLNALGDMANLVVKETGLDALILCRAIIDECYDTGKVNRTLLMTLCNRDNALEAQVEALRNSSLEPQARLYQLIKTLEKYMAERPEVVGAAYLSKDLLEVNTILFPFAPKSLLYVDTSNQFDEYRISPYVRTVEHNDTYALQLDIFARGSKKRKMLMVPKTRQNLIDNLLFDQLCSKVAEVLMNDQRSFDPFKSRPQNLLFASHSWVLMLR